MDPQEIKVPIIKLPDGTWLELHEDKTIHVGQDIQLNSFERNPITDKIRELNNLAIENFGIGGYVFKPVEWQEI